MMIVEVLNLQLSKERVNRDDYASKIYLPMK